MSWGKTMPTACSTGICCFIVPVCCVVLLAAACVSGTIPCLQPDTQDIFCAGRLFSPQLNQKNTMISQKLLDIIACPKCKGPVQLAEAQDSLVCSACQLVYEIQDGIPIMLLEEAKPLLQPA
jgi:uncharacterized protein YbaR (Trm112 family)